MKLQDQVCSLEQAKKLQELGVVQDSQFYFDDGELFWAPSVSAQPAYYKEYNIYAAFTTAELGVMLPPYPTCNWETYYQQGERSDCMMCYSQLMDKAFAVFKTEAFCRAQILIYMLEKRKILVEHVNQRLTSFNQKENA